MECTGLTTYVKADDWVTMEKAVKVLKIWKGNYIIINNYITGQYEKI
jgi:hypothetical protein